jgi:L-asparagine transporter-like permease
MSVRSAMSLTRMALLFFLAESPFVPVLAVLYPGYVAAIVLASAFFVAAPMGLVLARALQRGSEDELAERYRKSERLYVLAAAASQAGAILTSLGRRDVFTPGIVVSAGGMWVALWLLLKAPAEGFSRDAHPPTPMDHGPLE